MEQAQLRWQAIIRSEVFFERNRDSSSLSRSGGLFIEIMLRKFGH